MQALWNIIKNFWEIISTQPLSEMTPLEFFVLAIFSFFLFLIFKQIFSIAHEGAKTTWKSAKSLIGWRKRRMAKVVCPRCGRHLEKCQCPTNKGLSLKKRYKKYKAEKKLQKLQAKIQ
jgi:hypothetical protein